MGRGRQSIRTELRRVEIRSRDSRTLSSPPQQVQEVCSFCYEAETVTSFLGIPVLTEVVMTLEARNRDDLAIRENARSYFTVLIMERELRWRNFPEKL